MGTFYWAGLPEEIPGPRVHGDDAHWTDRYEPIRHPSPLCIGLTVGHAGVKLGPLSSRSAAFMQAHEAWFQDMFVEMRDRFLFDKMRSVREYGDGWYRDVPQPPDGMLGLINARLAHAFGPLVQCIAVTEPYSK